MNKSVIISCAGKGSRLGFNIPKCLVSVDGKKIIERQLEQLKNVEDIIIVVGYKSDEVIEFVKSLNYNVRFVKNNNWENTATGASFSIGAKIAKNNFVISLDGDLLVHPLDMEKILNIDEQFVCGEMIHTDNPVFLVTDESNNALNFNREYGNLEWSGLAGIKKENIKEGKWYVCDIMQEVLPLKAIIIKAREIDTINDFNEAERWIKNNYDD